MSIKTTILISSFFVPFVLFLKKVHRIFAYVENFMYFCSLFWKESAGFWLQQIAKASFHLFCAKTALPFGNAGFWLLLN